MAGTVRDIDGTVTGTIRSVDGTVSGALSNTQSPVVGALSTGPVGTLNYNGLKNKPSIESVVLEGNKTLKQIGVDTASVHDIEKILYSL